MMKRNPSTSQAFSEMLPGTLADVVDNVRQQLAALANHAGADPEILIRRGLEFNAVERKFQVHPPPEVIEQIREPWPHKEMVELLFRMTWRVLISAGRHIF